MNRQLNTKKSKTKGKLFRLIFFAIFMSACGGETVPFDTEKRGYDTVFYSDGVIKSINGVHGDVRNGPFASFFKEGLLRTMGVYKEGKLSGVKVQFFKTGELCGVTNWDRGNRHGETKFFNKDGMIRSYSFWKNDTLLFKCEYSPNGAMISEEGEGIIAIRPKLIDIDLFFEDSIAVIMANPPMTNPHLAITQFGPDSNKLKSDTFKCNGSVLTLHLNDAGSPPTTVVISHILENTMNETRKESHYFWER